MLNGELASAYVTWRQALLLVPGLALGLIGLGFGYIDGRFDRHESRIHDRAVHVREMDQVRHQLSRIEDVLEKIRDRLPAKVDKRPASMVR